MIRLFRVSIPTSVLLLLVMDAIVIAASYMLAVAISLNDSIEAWLYIRYEGGWIQIAFVVAVTQLGLYMMDLYSDLRVQSRAHMLQQLSLLLGASFLIQALIGYSELTTLQLPQWTMMYGSLLLALLLPAWRMLFFSMVRRALPHQKLLLVGASPVAEEVLNEVQRQPNLGFRIVGYLDDQDGLAGIARLGSLANLMETVQQHKPDRVIVCLRDLPAGDLMQSLLDLRMEGYFVEAIGELYEQIFGRVSIRDLQPRQVVFSTEMGPHSWTLTIQTVYSFVLGVVGFTLSVPVMLVVAALVRLSSPGPVLYRQKRAGRFGKPFFLYKFRSMYVDAEARTGPVWASKNDPRVTPLGRWLRKLRLDELPQFFNVLRGEMALVGPRPERPEFCAVLEKQIPFYQQRHFVKPGITGWAQINHKYTETVEDTMTKLEYDLYYVKHLTPTLDAYIVFHTLKVMLLSRGAQ